MARRALLVTLLLLAVPATSSAADLTVYSAMPRSGLSSDQANAIVAGARLALERAGGRAGGHAVRLVSLDDATAQAGTWTPRRVVRAARRAVGDGSAVAYLGHFNSGASALALPITNRAGLLQVSPSNTAVGLTRSGPLAGRREPGRYYPTGRRTYGRIVPADHVQAGAAAVAMRDARRRRVLFVHDGEIYGRGLAQTTLAAARRRGMARAGFVRLRGDGRNARAIARLARRRRADAVFYGGITANGAVDLWRAMRSRPRVRLFAGDGVAEEEFTRRIGGALARRTRITLSNLSPGSYPAAGQEVLRSLGPRTDVYALYGFETMGVILDAIARGGPARRGVVDAFFATRDRDSVLGRYSIDRRGDTTLTRYGLYRVIGGALRFDRAIDAAAP